MNQSQATDKTDRLNEEGKAVYLKVIDELSISAVTRLDLKRMGAELRTMEELPLAEFIMTMMHFARETEHAARLPPWVKEAYRHCVYAFPPALSPRHLPPTTAEIFGRMTEIFHTLRDLSTLKNSPATVLSLEMLGLCKTGSCGCTVFQSV